MKTIATLLIICAAFSGNSQTFQWDTNDSIVEDLAQNTMVQYPMYQSVVSTGDTVTLAIEVIYNDIPNTWDGMLCIYGICLGSIPNVGTQATMDPIYDGQQGMVRLTVNPNNGTEYAKLQVYVYDVNHPNDGDTATWILNPSALSLTELAKESMKFGPNPTGDVLHVQVDGGMDAVHVIDVNGRIVRSLPVTGTETAINVADLPAGTYTVEAQVNGNVVRNRFIKK